MSVRSIPYSQPCLSCDKPRKLEHGGFCDTCVAEFEDEIALDDVPRPERGVGRIFYGGRLADCFGSSPEGAA